MWQGGQYHDSPPTSDEQKNCADWRNEKPTSERRLYCDMRGGLRIAAKSAKLKSGHQFHPSAVMQRNFPPVG